MPYGRLRFNTSYTLRGAAPKALSWNEVHSVTGKLEKQFELKFGYAIRAGEPMKLLMLWRD